MRSTPQPAYILHVRPYKDSSAICECLSLQHGLVSLVARGAKRPRSRLNMYMRPFLLLQIAWMGRGELKTLTHVEAEQTYSVLIGEKLLLGLYLNELLIRLLQHDDPHPQLFHDYQLALHGLAAGNEGTVQQSVLRRFELKLLTALGYGVNLPDPIIPDLLYSYDPLCGIYDISSIEQSPDMLTVSGATLIALQRGEFSDRELIEAKKLMRFILKFHLGAKPLQSRKLFPTKSEANGSVRRSLIGEEQTDLSGEALQAKSKAKEPVRRSLIGEELMDLSGEALQAKPDG